MMLAMKSPHLTTLAALALAACFAATAARAETMPDLKGIWTGESKIHFHHQAVGTSTQTMVIKQQSEEGFTGELEWNRSEYKPGSDGAASKTTGKGKLEFAGVVGFDGKTLHIVTHGPQENRMEAKLISPNEMEVIVTVDTENHAMAFRAKLTRKGS